MSTQIQLRNIQGIGKQDLDKRLEAIGWGMLLIIVGASALVPAGQVPDGAWLVVLGVMLLGLNAGRVLSGIKTRWFTTILGLSALLSGLGLFYGLRSPFWPLLLILTGAYILCRPWFDR
jgi:hypothetical protein